MIDYLNRMFENKPELKEEIPIVQEQPQQDQLSLF
ncbi:hypothetical protein PMI10_00640 [Flavobacterium sp. CF136]|nr:hypothetical protein PMI10_00640 [Flavobacterium sp. CF136]